MLWWWNHCTENYVFFFQMSWKDGLALEYDLSRIIGKGHVSLSWKLSLSLSLTLGRKWKMIFFKKIQGNMILFSGLLRRRSFQEGSRRDMIFLVLSGKMVFFSRKHIFFLGQEASDNLSQEIHGNMTFFVYTCSCYKPDVTPAPLPCQEKSRMALSPQNTPKGDWSSRLTSWKELQQFFVSSQRPLRAFSCIAIQRKKKQET